MLATVSGTIGGNWIVEDEAAACEQHEEHLDALGKAHLGLAPADAAPPARPMAAVHALVVHPELYRRAFAVEDVPQNVIHTGVVGGLIAANDGWTCSSG